MARSESTKGALIGFAGAILGAVLGGLGSLAGVYVTSESQAEEKAFERRQVAYGEFLSAAHEYRQVLERATDALDSSNQEMYTEARADMFEVGPTLTAAAGLVVIVRREEEDLTLPVRNALFKPNEYRNIADCNIEEFQTAEAEGYEAIEDFISQVREEFHNND